MGPRLSRRVAIQSPEDTQRAFDGTVFPAELEEIACRRRVAGLDAEPPEKHVGAPAAGLDLLGLALSGGGIRSAALSLGVVQELAKRGVLRKVDYLSTVSGGGYLGSALSSLLNEPDGRTGPEAHRFPLRKEPGAEEPPPLRHLRNGSNYLSPGGFLDKLRLPTVVLRGIVLNFVFILPYVFIAVFLTALAHELELYYLLLNAIRGWFGVDPKQASWVAPLLVVVGAFTVMVVTFPFVTKFFRTRFRWQHRNTYERVLAAAFLVSIAVLVLIPLLRLVDLAVEDTAAQLWANIVSSPLNPLSYGLLGGLGVVVAAVALVVAGQVSAVVAALFRWLGTLLLGLAGPAVVFVTYLLLCLWQINPAFEVPSAGSISDSATVDTLNMGRVPKSLADAFTNAGDELAAQTVTVSVEQPGRRWDINAPPRGQSVGPIDRALNALVGRWYVVTVRDTTESEAYLHVVPPLVDPRGVVFLVVGVLLLWFNVRFLDINLTSPHVFYRDRLSRVFLIRQRDGAIVPNDEQKLSSLNVEGSAAPYHLINAALNLKGSGDPNLRGRNADFFVFSKHFVGSERTGWCPTGRMEEVDRHLDLGTAMAISAAAAAPNMGTVTMGQLVFLMTLLNIRLGYWLPNPAGVEGRHWYNRVFRGAGPSYLVKEAMGSTHARGSYVNVSDGGHIENLGVYQLLRRRCARIIAVDGEADPDMTFGSLSVLMRYARIDLGIEIDIDLDPLRKNANGLSRAHWAVGRIEYGNGQTGELLYIKSSTTGDEPEDLRQFAQLNPAFPHQSTADQFFTEAQFEVYRTLGEHIARGAWAPGSANGTFGTLAAGVTAT